ncbi:MAG: hypothetical protein WAP51_03350 [Candidatus Sungiibacteriota bacterium]
MPWYVKILVILVLSLTLNQGYALGGHVKGPKGMPEIKFFTQEYPRHTECGQLTKKTHVQRTEKEEITWTIFFSGDSENPLLTIYEKLKYGYMVEGFIIADFWLDKDQDGHIDYHERNSYPNWTFEKKYPTPCDAIK